MIWLGIVIGIVVGAGGYYLYDKFFGKAEAAYKAAEGAFKK